MKKPTPAKPSGMVEITCTCDRLPLPDGTFLVRDQIASVPVADAVNYEAAERAKRG